MCKLLFIPFTLLFTFGCQVQINLASSVVNVPVYKTQLSEGNSEMSGSDIKNPNNDQTTDTVIPVR